MMSDKMQPVSLFSKLSQRQWRKARRLLKSKDAHELCKEVDSTNLTCLGVALGFEAPLEIIKLIIEANSEMVFHLDSFGASCLHVACLNGASIESIEYLLKTFPELSRYIDDDKRVPLHHAVEYACQSSQENEPYYLKVIDIMYRICPETIHVSDIVHDSPVDLVQMFITRCEGNDLERLQVIYRLLNSFSIEQYKKKKYHWENQGYDTSKVMSKKNLDCPTLSTATVSQETKSIFGNSILATERHSSENDEFSKFMSASNDDIFS
jgi:hypothetical protein